MQKIYSSTKPELLAHIIIGIPDFNGRSNLSLESEFLQVSSLKIDSKKSFKSHIHIWKDFELESVVAQEAWVVIRGQVEASYFDLDGKFLKSLILNEGDCSVTFHGGHGFTILKDSFIYEFKTGPYLGVEKDKIFLDKLQPQDC